MNDEAAAHQEQLKFLLADFAAIKAEIARRSSLQRVVLVVYAAALAFVFREFVSSSGSHLWLLATWASATLSFQFYAREGLEIMRLSSIIRDRIAQKAAELTGGRKEDLLPSETNLDMPRTRARRIAYDCSFNWALFFGVPTALSAVFVVKNPQALTEISKCGGTAFLNALLTAVIAARCAILLVRHASHWSQDA
jgi:hypothetical protein